MGCSPPSEQADSVGFGRQFGKHSLDGAKLGVQAAAGDGIECIAWLAAELSVAQRQLRRIPCQ